MLARIRAADTFCAVVVYYLSAPFRNRVSNLWLGHFVVNVDHRTSDRWAGRLGADERCLDDLELMRAAAEAAGCVCC